VYKSCADVNSMLIVINIDTLQPVDRISFSGEIVAMVIVVIVQCCCAVYLTHLTSFHLN